MRVIRPRGETEGTGQPGASGDAVVTVTPPRVVDVFLNDLVREGVTVVFGVPGGLLHPFFEAVEQDPRLDLIVTKHEQGAAFMADGFARASGRLAVCAGTSGPGATNLLTGVSVSFSDGVPVVVVTGQAPSHALGKGAAQETSTEDIDIVAMFRPVTRYSAMVTSPSKLAHHVRRGLRRALGGRCGPVHFNVPVDLWEHPLAEEVVWDDPHSYRPSSQVFDRRAVKSASEALVQARHPALLVGSGTPVSARGPLVALAERIRARVATTPRAKGLFPEDHPQSLGVLGFAGHRAAREALLGDTVDVLMTVGASLNETSTLNWNPGLQPSAALIQVDIDEDVIGRNYPVDIPIVGDAQTVLVELGFHIERLLGAEVPPASEWGEPAPARGCDRVDAPELCSSDAVPLTPQRWRRDLEAALPDNTLIFSDIGGHMLFNIHYLTVRANQRFCLNLGFGSMGHGTSAPIGAKLASPGRPVVAIIGDACFTMAGMEMLTAVEYDVPVIWIVENNQMHGITWHGSTAVSGHPMRSIKYKKPLDVAGMARAMGLAVFVVDQPSQLTGTLAEALATGRPCLIEIKVDGSISPPLGDRAKTIAGFRNE